MTLPADRRKEVHERRRFEALRTIALMRRTVRVFVLAFATCLAVSYCCAQTKNTRALAESSVSNKPELVVQLGQGGSIDAVAFSSDAKLILTADFGSSGSAVLWDVATAAEVRTFKGGSEELKSVALSPDNRFVLTGGYDGVARLWNAATGEQARILKAPMGPVLAAAFSADSRYVLTGSSAKYLNGQKVVDDMVRVWDAQTGSLIRSIPAQWPFTFSTDGRFVIAATEGNDARLLDMSTGEEIKRFALPDHLGDAMFSADGRELLTTAVSNAYDSQASRTYVLWDLTSGKEIRRIANSKALRPSLSPDGRYLLLSEAEVLPNSLKLATIVIDITTGEELKRLANVWGMEFSPDASSILTADASNLRFWDFATGKQLKIFRGYSSDVLSTSLSADDRYLATGSGGGTAHLWDLNTGQEIQRYVSGGNVDYAALSPDGSFLFTEGFDNPGQVWQTMPGVPLRKIYGRLKTTEAVALSPDGRYIFTGGFDNPARLWDPLTGKEVRRFNGSPGTVQEVAFSPDSCFVVTLNYANDNSWRGAVLWEVATGNEVRRFKVPAQMGLSLAISPDNRFMAVGGFDPAVGRNTNSSSPFIFVGGASPNYDNAYLFDLTTGTLIRSFVGHSGRVGSAVFSPDGRQLLTGSWDDTARLWDVATGRQLRVLKGHSSMVWAVGFSHDGHYIITGSLDSMTRFWRADDGREICRLISFKNGNWLVVAPDGRFDTNDLDEIKGVNWVMPDDPFTPIPAEVFMRDYYEPRLLPRLLSGEKFPLIKSVAEVNRVQPKVKIGQILWDSVAHDQVSIAVQVSSASREFVRGNDKIKVESGVYDLRLFRDGQLVGHAPETSGEVKLDPVTKQGVVTFRGVKLPKQKEISQIDFAAYAFNVDRVKSATDYKGIKYPQDLSPAKGRVYLITVGVNAYENSEWNLKYAANDARQIQRTLSDKMSQSADYSEVIPVSLISDYKNENGLTVVKENLATKANIKAVLDLLAGKQVDEQVLRTIPNAEKLRAATPDDLVIISFSSHGYAGQNGAFYFIPYDVGAGSKREITPEILKHLISSDELSLWLRDVDAGDMVMIVDACHSAASVQGEGFKPGPMGSRGLGQLSYDKGIRILTSTQSDDVALETDVTQQGLLSYALTHDGIEAGQADFKPRDGVINLAEWLEYAVDRVPKLYGEIAEEYQSLALNQLKNISVGNGGRTRLLVFARDGSNSSFKKGAYQQPSLFDFTRKRKQVVLAKTK